MKKLLKFAMEVCQGVDMIVAMTAFLIASMLFGYTWSFVGLGSAVLFAHLPDADMIPYLLLKKVFGVKFRLPSHRIIGHHPLLVIPLVVFVLYLVAGDMFPYFATIAIVALTGHFLHDSMEPQGFHWLSPFYWGRVTLYHWNLKFVPVRVWVRIHLTKGKTYDKDVASEVIERADPIEENQKKVWALLMLLLLTYAFVSLGIFSN